MWNKLINIFIALGIFLLIPVSCIKEDMGSENCDMTYVMFSLRINGETRSLTRADETWGDDYNKSAYENDYDNYIDVSSLQVLLFNDSNTYVGTLEDIFYQGTDGNIVFTGKAPSGLTQGSYKIVILANSETPTLTAGTSTLSDLASLTYTLYENSAPKDIAIPVWGITTETLTLVKGKKQDIGTIDLLRSMARVIVYLDPNVNLAGDTVKLADRYDITSVSISEYNQSGNVLPSSYDVSATTDIVTEAGSFNENASSFATTLPISGTSLMNRASGDSAIVYLPEIENSDDGSVKISITLTGKNINGVSTNYSYENAISFLLDSAYCDIVRNHSYNFKIKNAYKGSLTANLEVLPWDLEEEDISIDDSFVINEGGYLNFTVPTGVTRTEASDGLTFTFPQTNPDDVVLPFTFKIDGPTNSYWVASIVNSNPTNPAFVFCDESGTELTDGTVGEGNVSINVTNTYRAGKIDGVSNTLYVKCTQTPGSSEFSATLYFYLYNPTTQTYYIIQNMVDNTGVEKTVTFKLDPAS